MNLRSAIVVVSLGLLQVLGACSRPDDRVKVEVATCGQLAAWDLPDGMEASSPDLDSAWVGNQRTITLARINLAVLAAESFCELRGRYPLDLPELLLASTDGSLPSRCSVSEELLTDWWGHPIRYETEPGMVVTSPGEDGVFGTPDDFRSPPAGSVEGAHDVDVEAECSRS